jgi:polyhydroxyalkanoate synthesis repressor PhaR
MLALACIAAANKRSLRDTSAPACLEEKGMSWRTTGCKTVARPTDTEDEAKAGKGGVVVIKKYANRRLYNTATSSYVTLEHLSEMVREGTDFVVHDAKTGEDITRSVLTQIIFEQESRGQNLLPVHFLRRLIRFYGDQMQSLVPGYLDMSMDAFVRGQERWRDQMTRAFGAPQAGAAFEEQARQNMALFEQAMRLWAPVPGAGLDDTVQNAEPARPKPDETATLESLKSQMEAMQRQLDQLARPKEKR